MGFKRVVTDKQRELGKRKKQNKAKHAGKDWDTLNTNDKFEIIGDDLKVRNVID